MGYGKMEALVVGRGELKGRSVRCGAMDRAARLPSVWSRWDEEEKRSPFSRFWDVKVKRDSSFADYERRRPCS